MWLQILDFKEMKSNKSMVTPKGREDRIGIHPYQFKATKVRFPKDWWEVPKKLPKMC